VTDPTSAAPPPSILDAAGGWLGMAESSLPGALFVAVYTASGQSTRSAAIAAVALAAALALARAVRRQTPIYALSGVAGVAIAGYVATRTGKAENFFLPGLLLNAAYAGAFVVSIVARWPLIGVAVANLTRGEGGSGTAWREDPLLVRAYTRASWIWVALFALRIAVQLPLYLGDALVALGVARVAMGVPLFVVGIWLSWLLLRSVGGGPWKAREPTPDP
jgi:Protein of unknown function (DUF3159)